MNITVNGESRTVEEGLTIADLLGQLTLPNRGIAVELNLEVVPRSRHGEWKLAEGDTLEVVSLVGGG
jgi:sulfur carrier protein